MDDRTLERIRGGELALIPQNAGQSLTPTSRVGQQINESVKLHTKLVKEQRRERTIELLSQVRLPEPEALSKRFPHELSRRSAAAGCHCHGGWPASLTFCCSTSRRLVSMSLLKPMSSSYCAIWRRRPEPQWFMSATTWGRLRG